MTSDDDDLSYLFVVTYGRSGSTLVSGLLNAIPGYLVRGENDDALRHLHAFHTTLLEQKARRTGTRSRTHPFYGIGDVPRRKLVARTRELALDTVLRPKPGTRVVGFKEIRWGRGGLDELRRYVAWLREVFPGARFVVNTRDHESVLSSAWWARGDRAHKAAHLVELEAWILTVAAELGEAAYRLHYDDFVADPTVLRGLYDWLGEPWDEESVRATLAVRHSVTPGRPAADAADAD